MQNDDGDDMPIDSGTSAETSADDAPRKPTRRKAASKAVARTAPKPAPDTAAGSGVTEADEIATPPAEPVSKPRARKSRAKAVDGAPVAGTTPPEGLPVTGGLVADPVDEVASVVTSETDGPAKGARRRVAVERKATKAVDSEETADSEPVAAAANPVRTRAKGARQVPADDAAPPVGQERFGGESPDRMSPDDDRDASTAPETRATQGKRDDGSAERRSKAGRGAKSARSFKPDWAPEDDDDEMYRENPGDNRGNLLPPGQKHFLDQDDEVEGFFDTDLVDDEFYGEVVNANNRFPSDSNLTNPDGSSQGGSGRRRRQQQGNRGTSARRPQGARHPANAGAAPSGARRRSAGGNPRPAATGNGAPNQNGQPGGGGNPGGNPRKRNRNRNAGRSNGGGSSDGGGDGAQGGQVPGNSGGAQGGQSGQPSGQRRNNRSRRNRQQRAATAGPSSGD